MKFKAEVINMLEDCVHILDGRPDPDVFKKQMIKIETLIEILGNDTPAFYRRKLEEWKAKERFLH